MVVRFWGLLLLPSLALAGHDKNAQLVSKGWNPTQVSVFSPDSPLRCDEAI
jgi:hypothetical protein